VSNFKSHAKNVDQAVTKENIKQTRFEKTKADKKKESSTCKDKILTVGHKTTSCKDNLVFAVCFFHCGLILCLIFTAQ